MSIEELLADESFVRYCEKSNPADIAYWEKFLEDNPEYTLIAGQAFQLYHEIYHSMFDLSQQENLLRQKLSAETVSQPLRKVKMHRLTYWLKWSAAACVALFIGYYLYTGFSQPDKQIIYATANGERKTLQLPDGTLVILNGGSTVVIEESFNKSSRNVSLQGEAYFDVKPDTSLPFIVYTAYMDVRAVGTAFSIKAYPLEKTAETVLINGLVEVTLKEENNKKVLLQPYQKVSVKGLLQSAPGQSAIVATPVYDTTGVIRQVTAQGEVEVSEIAWTQNRLVIDDHSLEEIAVMLERWYGVNIAFVDQDIRDYRYTGSFEKEELNTVLEFLKESRYFRYEMVNDELRTIKFYRK